jgi:hypothetical protein
MYDFREQGWLDARACHDAMNPAEGDPDNLVQTASSREQ